MINSDFCKIIMYLIDLILRIHKKNLLYVRKVDFFYEILNLLLIRYLERLYVEKK